MKKYFGLIIGSFIVGLCGLIGLVAWNLSSMSSAIEAERSGSALFSEKTTSIHQSMQLASTYVGQMFAVSKVADVNEIDTKTKQALSDMEEMLEQLRSDDFGSVHSEFIVLQENQLETDDGSESSAQENSATEEQLTVLDIIKNVTGAMETLRVAQGDVAKLAATKIEVAKKLEPSKKNLSKVVRKNFDLRQLDEKAYNDLSRGALTVLYTTTGTDIKFAGRAKFEKGYSNLKKKNMTTSQAKGLEDIKVQFDETYALARQALSLTTDSDFFTRQADSIVSQIEDLSFTVSEIVKQRQDQLVEKASSTTWLSIVVGAVVTLVSVVIGILLAKKLTDRITSVINVSRRITQGDLDLEVEGQDVNDEIGTLAATIETFRINALEKVKLEEEQVLAEKRAEENSRKAMNDLADSFEEQVGGIISSIGTSVEGMTEAASAMSETAEQTNNQAAAGASASQEASANVSTVAAAAEQLSTSIGEIQDQVSLSSTTSGQAVKDSSQASDQIQSLVEATNKIDAVVSLITDIAEQTNLLALNATIEAARAGDAGKGFAVVASEVKNLASQTASATDEIAGYIKQVQLETSGAVEAIGNISTRIVELDQISTAIAAAIEEQGASTQEIARNVQEASQGTENVSRNIESISQAANETGQSAEHVLTTSGDMKEQTTLLQANVAEFLNGVRTG